MSHLPSLFSSNHSCKHRQGTVRLNILHFLLITVVENGSGYVASLYIKTDGGVFGFFCFFSSLIFSGGTVTRIVFVFVFL